LPVQRHRQPLRQLAESPPQSNLRIVAGSRMRYRGGHTR
jgi:hypothetical protein